MSIRFLSGQAIGIMLGLLAAIMPSSASAQPINDFDLREYESMLGGMSLPNDEQLRRHQNENALTMPSAEEMEGYLGDYKEQLGKAIDKLDGQSTQQSNRQGAWKPFRGAASEEERNAYAQELGNAQGVLVDSFSTNRLSGGSVDHLMGTEQSDRLQALLQKHEHAKKILENQMKGGTYAVPEDALIVFVSFSMPERVLKNLAQQAREVGAVMVLRGMVDGKLSATQDAARRVNAAGAAWEINPELFKTFDVQTVPAFVLTGNKDAINQGCAVDSSGQCSPTNTFSKVSGDISIEIALDTIRRRTDIPFIRGQAAKRLQKLNQNRG